MSGQFALDPASTDAAQAALDRSPDRSVRDAIRLYIQTGIPPARSDVLQAINGVRAARGLPPVTPLPVGPAGPIGDLPIPDATPRPAGLGQGVVTGAKDVRSAEDAIPAALPGAGGGGGGTPAIGPSAVPVPGASLAGTGEDPYIGGTLGDQNALQGILDTVLQGLGINMDRPGLYADIAQKQIGQYLPFYMASMGPDQARSGAAAFQKMMGGQGAFAGLADWATKRATDLGDIGDTDPDFQQKTVQGLMDMVGANQDKFKRAVTQARMNALNNQFTRAGLDRSINYIDFIREKAKTMPEFARLLPLLGAGPHAAPDPTDYTGQ